MLRIHNTLTGKKEEFHPLHEGEARIYTCGPTVYDYAHIGNFRTFVFQDILCRYLRYRNYKVLHVMNITDVDDKTIKNARAQGMSLKDYTTKYTEAFLEDSKTLRLQPPDIMPLATDHIPEMIQLIKQLEEKGYAYRKEGSVYFSISRFADYGKLSKKDLSGMQAGARVDSDEYEKDDVRDFVLWKAPKEDEDSWDTELGPGRPGWHIECSAMSIKYLGSSFDIHCGGIDLVFPHHENEIAQSECATGKPFVRYWIHPEFLLFEGEKMAKSKGNQFNLRDLLAQQHTPEAIRYLLLSVNYGRQLNFTTEGLRQAQSSIQRLEDFVQRLEEISTGDAPRADFEEEVQTARQKFLEAMDDDFNTSAALAAIFEFVRIVNQKLERNEVSGGDARFAKDFITELDGVLGVLKSKDKLLDDDVKAAIKERLAARRRRDFAEADRIRDDLLSRGIQLEDTREGTRWKRIQSKPN